MRIAVVASTLMVGLIASTSPAQEHHHPASDQELGRVKFSSSCNVAAAPLVEKGVAMLHSFWFDEAAKTFEQGVAVDSTCAMAHWGIAMTMLGNPFTAAPPSKERAEAGLRAARRGVELAAGSSPREQGYARAALVLYERADSLDYRARMLAHEEALRTLHEAAPDDTEAAIFLARAMIANAPPDDLEFRRQLAAASILEPLFLQQADHPGLAHYIIHAFDAPPIAQQGLAAAMRYADIAPAAPHALHMPSHIFTRLGHWEQSVATNRRSAAAEPDSNAAVHPLDYMVYAHLQLGQDAAARQVVDRATDHMDRFYGGLLGYNAAAMPARYALERNAWREAAELGAPTTGVPYVRAITQFARAIGGARSGNREVASSSTEALAALRDSLAAARERYWATVVGAQQLAAAAWLARLDGDDGRALQLARQAAELEETVEKHPVTPGPLLPARELEGDLLMELGRHAAARAAYERTLSREPNRARTLFGAGRSAELSGDAEAAARHYRQLVELMSKGDGTREELAVARRFLDHKG
jgi:tetratricopeptide (TPR) repeat protein